jgi:hypothetical protein
MPNTETLAAPRNTEEQLVVRLRSLPRFQMSAGSLDEYTSFVGEEECEHGDWIRASAIDALIGELTHNNSVTGAGGVQ